MFLLYLMTTLTPCPYTNFTDEEMHSRVDYVIARAILNENIYEDLIKFLDLCFSLDVN